MRRFAGALAFALCVSGCGEEKAPAPPPAVAPAAPAPGVDPARLPELLARMNRGLAALERYDYGLAAEELKAAVAAAPGFYPAQFNLAIALLNNQKEPELTEKALRAAAALAPKEAAPRFVLGILLSQGVSPPRNEAAEAEFRAAVGLAPGDADAHHRLGMAVKTLGRPADAEASFTKALEINPFLGAALYQRGLNRILLERDADGKADLARFQEMEVGKRVDAREISYGSMGPLADAVRDLEPWLPPAAPPHSSAVRFEEVPSAMDDATDPGGTIAVADMDGDGLLDLVFGGKRPRWRQNEGGFKFGAGRELPLGESGSPDHDLCIADFDSDGNLDAAIRETGIVLGAGAAKPDVRRFTTPGPLGRSLAADLDADGDLDLVCGRTVLLNDAKANFTPGPGPVTLPDKTWAPLFLRDIDDDGFPDLVGADLWVRNLRAGAFGGAEPLPPALADLVRGLANRSFLAVADVDADGVEDVVQVSGDGVVVARGGVTREGGHQAAGWSIPESPKGGRARAGVFADLDRDGDLDLVLAQGGVLRILANVGDAGKRTLHLRLKGVLHANGRQFGWTNPRGVGARVEAIAGRIRARRQVGLDLALDGKPPADEVALGLGGAAKADLVSVRWTEGVIQAEIDVAIPPAPPVAPTEIAEVQRKAASCPVVFSWDGEKFAFVADCMGGGGLGFYFMPGGPGKPAIYGPPDPTERVRIAPEQLRPRDGFYEVRLIEPLEEVCLADRLALTAVDHPADSDAHPDERFGSAGPTPGERVYAHRRADMVFPAKAVDRRGADVLARLARTDRDYADDFDLHRDLLGFTAEDHWVDLDFADRVPALAAGERLVLFLDGWIEYGYSRTFYAAAGAGVVPLSPVLEVPDGKGGWKTAIPDIGYPAGTPRTMTFDVTGVVTPASPRFRIRTNLEIYWDRIRLAVDRGEGGLVRTTAAPAAAVLRFAGFPREVSPDGKHPKVNDYGLMDPAVPGFKALRGAYTRFGDVLPLVKDADDRFVVFRNGEEIALRFRVADFPPLREGWTRTFLLETTGWCKDMDYHTAEFETVEPLPYLSMPEYPPPPGKGYPDDEAHRAWRREWNTRVVR